MVRSWPRVIDMNVSRLETIEHIRKFLAGTAEVAFSHPADESARRIFVATVLKRYRYVGLPKGSRGVLFAYMQRLTGYSRQHLSRLIAQYRDTQSIKPLNRASRTSFTRIYGAEDVALLAETEGLGLRGGLGPGPWLARHLVRPGHQGVVDSGGDAIR